MSYWTQFFEITFWIIPVYLVLSIILCVIFWVSHKTNATLKQKIERWIGIINITFAVWFVAMTIYEVARTQVDDFGFRPDFDSSTWFMIISSILFLVSAWLKKFRKSPYSMIGISIVIVINFIIAYSSVAIIV